MTTKAKGSSVRQRLADLSRKLDIPYQNLETAFILNGVQVVAWKHLGIGETKIEKMEFRLLSLREAIQAFTEAAYAERLTFESV